MMDEMDERTYQDRRKGGDDHIPMSAPKRKGITKARVLKRAGDLGVLLEDRGHILAYRGVEYYPTQYQKLYNRLPKL